jgi:membrane protease YdiL (CAAX protease family)
MPVPLGITQKPPEPRSRLWAEFLLLFVAGPLIILTLRRPGILFLTLWIGGFICYRLSRPPPGPLPDLQGIARRIALIAPFLIGLLLMFFTRPSAEELEHRRQTRAVLLRFLILGALLTLFVRTEMPGQYLDLPRHHPTLWLAIMLLYPLLSVWPQEVIFRRFFFARYQPIFGNTGLVAASALAFGFAHIIFLNWVAVVMTVVGGAIFAADYARYRRLGLACLEHSLYGCLIFTIGLGRYFYTGAAWHH